MAQEPGENRRKAFTLVELLVVIGVIGVLISILLPSLQRAREQAYSVACQSNLHQMGVALQIYIVDNRGVLPWGGIDNDQATYPWEDGRLPNATNKEYTTWWTFTLSQLVNKNTYSLTDGLVHNLAGMFRDYDTIPGNDYRYVNHYTCNPRVLYGNWYQDYAANTFSGGVLPPIDPQNVQPRKMAQIKPSDVFVFWDAPQCLGYNNNALEIATELDSNQLTFGTAFILGSQNPAVVYNRCLDPGQFDGGNAEGVAICLSNQKKFNLDTVFGFTSSTFPFITQSEMRFRHMNNTSLNALCLDGHVESRLVGQFMVPDVCTNYPQ